MSGSGARLSWSHKSRTALSAVSSHSVGTDDDMCLAALVSIYSGSLGLL